MALFVEISISKKCIASSGCTKCVDSCPLAIFELRDRTLTVNDENTDECTFCDICSDRCPVNALTITKNY
ncbi:MAG: 4Fe-4S binding protein [Actinobacteria bacterium]|nr:4Fe-4S binding protein [Actinomycetota bacterium]